MYFDARGFTKELLKEFDKILYLNIFAQCMIDNTIEYAIKNIHNKHEFVTYLLDIIPTEMKEEDVLKFFK